MSKMKVDEFCYRALDHVKEIRRRKHGKQYYFKLYKSFWHKPKGKGNFQNLYLTEVVSYGAGIGHKLANWNAGYWFARYFGLKYAYSPFTSSAVPFRPNKWDYLLGFGKGETTAEELLRAGYKKVQLPYFDESEEELSIIRRIIASYRGEKVVFFTEASQFYYEQYGVMEDISRKFFQAPARQEDKILYDSRFCNVAVHIRRTVIIDSKTIKEDTNQKDKRWTDNVYFEVILDQLLKINEAKPMRIYVFSTGEEESFAAFRRFGEVRICTDIDEYTSFVHLAKADILVTCKSSFSYKAALLSKGIKICPSGFWHGYPNTEDWFIIEPNGMFTYDQMENLKKRIIERRRETLGI